MINKPIDQITEKDLQSLIDNAVSEHKTIEYKQTLQVSSDSERKEFLADVSSFANASGGDLIFGISTEKEIPKALIGLDIPNAEITKLDSMLRDGIEPRLPSVYIQPIPLSNSKNALVIRIAKSWLSPHRITYKGHDKFYSRSTNGKYSLDVSELRIAFTLSEMLTEKIRKFREDRISKINADETPLQFRATDFAKTILHLIPLISFTPAQRYEIEKIAADIALMPPISPSRCYHRYNIDGLITYSGENRNDCFTYTQLYKNGIIEAVEASTIGTPYELPENKQVLLIHSIDFESNLIAALNKYTKLFQILKIELPIILFLTLVRVKGIRMALSNRRFSEPIDRDILMPQEIIIENYAIPADQILKPCFDAIWNACGSSGSLNYDEKGNWRKH